MLEIHTKMLAIDLLRTEHLSSQKLETAKESKLEDFFAYIWSKLLTNILDFLIKSKYRLCRTIVVFVGEFDANDIRFISIDSIE